MSIVPHPTPLDPAPVPEKRQSAKEDTQVGSGFFIVALATVLRHCQVKGMSLSISVPREGGGGKQGQKEKDTSEHIT